MFMTLLDVQFRPAYYTLQFINDHLGSFRAPVCTESLAWTGNIIKEGRKEGRRSLNVFSSEPTPSPRSEDLRYRLANLSAAKMLLGIPTREGPSPEQINHATDKNRRTRAPTLKTRQAIQPAHMHSHTHAYTGQAN